MQKRWITTSGHPCGICLANQAQDWIAFDAPFQSGALSPLQHPNCKCVLQGRLAPAAAKKYARAVAITGQEYWPVDSYQHGTAPGMGGPMPTIHDADGIQIDIAGGVPGATAGGEPPRWDGDEAPHLVTATPRSESEGRGDVQTLGGGTVGGPYEDRSSETHVGEPLDADDADWPEHRGVPPRPGRDWPAPYMDGYWPAGGHGTGQAPVTSIGGGDRGRPPNAHGKTVKGAADLDDPNPVDAEHVLSLMRKNFPEKALGWVKDARWIGPINVPQDRIDTDDEDSWAASHQPDAVRRFAKDIKRGTGHTHPVILVQHPGSQKAVIIDGHHRTLAYRKLGRPVKAYVGMVDQITKPMLETHSSQISQGASPANKAAGPVAAGLAVRAEDTGRVLMLQRAVTDDDPAAGMWEFPGGKLEPFETALQGALREWAEETGCQVPTGSLTGRWAASNGVYEGYVMTVQSEDCVPIFDGRDQVVNPDDPDGDMTEALAWWEPGHLRDNPSVRPELAGDLEMVLAALGGEVSKSAETPSLEATPDILGPEGLWHTPDRHVGGKQKLPNYIEHIAHALMRDQGMDESRAIATAINAVKRWAAGDLHWGKGKVSPEVQAASQRALAEWEALRQSHH